MNIWQQFNLVNQSFLSDWWILYWGILHALGNKKLAVFNLADFHNLPNHQNKFYAKFSSYTVCYETIHNFYKAFISHLVHKTKYWIIYA